MGNNIQDKIYQWSPNFVQNALISLFNLRAYTTRYSKEYKQFLESYKKNQNLSREDLLKIQKSRYKAFIQYTMSNSSYYNKALSKIEYPEHLKNIASLPIINKEVLRQNLDQIYTIPLNEGILSKTGGTTGKSLQVLYTKKDIQERFAILDNFRHDFGYALGKKTAWFSGKDLLTKSDIKRNRFWKTDYFYKVRYYSTFHIHKNYLKYYIANLITYRSEFLVGFPSTMYEIAKYGLQNNIQFPEGVVKAIFPTAETITKDIREVLERFFKTNLYNQYASSEGAPFILECEHHNLHLELQSGVFEVLGNNDEHINKGRLVVTAFNTHGTPLIRYDIGDEIELLEGTCKCGNNNPLVKSVLGRISDFIYSEETGKINLGNVSNCLKGVKGIIKFQIQQDNICQLIVLIEKDNAVFTKKDENTFLKNLRDRVGNKISIELNYIDNIPVEKSGKYRLIKNNIKDNI